MHSTNLFVLILLITLLLKFSISEPQPWLEELLYKISSDRITIERSAIENASTDFGKLGQTHPPAAVLFPESTSDIADLVRFSYESFSPFPVSAKGRAHSIHGQAQAQKGVVIEMMSLFSGEHQRIGKKYGRVSCMNVEKGVGISKEVCYVDVSGGHLWIDVLLESLKHGYAPVSWTDYLYLTVGGTLSNAGVSGQAFLHGPQINNVLEMDVITGKGEMFTCSRTENAELFYAVLGGLGQFGIITRARIHVEKAPHMVKWTRLAYSNFTDFTTDQEYLISLNGETKGREGFDYVEGFVMMGDDNGCSGTGSSKWRSTSFTFAHQHEHTNDSIFYCLEVCKYYTNSTPKHAEEVVGNLLSILHHMPWMVSQRDVGYVEFLDRVHQGELQLRSVGMWDVPHPWLCLFVPRSRILEFHDVVFRGIVATNNTNIPGPILLYPTNTNTWDPRMSAAVPTEEDVFYAVNLLRTAVKDWGFYEDQNRAIVTACEERNIDFKMYLPHYTQEREWKKHFGRGGRLYSRGKRSSIPEESLLQGKKSFVSPLMCSLELIDYDKLFV